MTSSIMRSKHCSSKARFIDSVSSATTTEHPCCFKRRLYRPSSRGSASTAKILANSVNKLSFHQCRNTSRYTSIVDSRQSLGCRLSRFQICARYRSSVFIFDYHLNHEIRVIFNWPIQCHDVYGAKRFHVGLTAVQEIR